MGKNVQQKKNIFCNQLSVKSTLTTFKTSKIIYITKTKSVQKKAIINLTTFVTMQITYKY